MKRRVAQAGQSTLEWVVGAAIILGTLVAGLVVWNQGLVRKMNEMLQALTRT